MADEVTAPLATPEDYTARYGEVTDPARLQALLSDATSVLLSAYEARWGEGYAPGVHQAFDRSAAAVCCLLANRVLSAPQMLTGATQYSQTAGGYNASVTYGSAMGEMYLGKTDLKRLGLYGSTIRELRPMLEVDDGLPDDS